MYIKKNKFIICNKLSVSDFVDEKMKKVERSFYSLNVLGCRPKMMRPETVSFLFKQFSQSIFRYHLDNIFISDKQLSEFDIRQNILVKRIIGLNKFTKTKPLNKALKLVIGRGLLMLQASGANITT